MYVVVLGLGWQQKKSILILKNYNYKIIGVDQNKNSICKKIINKFINIDFQKTNTVYKKIKKITKNPKYIFSFNSDAALVPSSILRNKFNLKGLSIYQSSLMTNKVSIKNLLKKNKFNYANYKIYLNKKNLKSKFKNFNFPIIIKPVHGSGSRGVQFFKTKEKLNNFIKNDNFYEKQKLIIEEYIKGQEFSIEAFVSNRKIKILSISKRKIFKKITAKEINTKKIDKLKYNLIEDTICKFINLTKIDNCPFHFEIIYTKNNKIYIIDAAARGGGYFVADYLVKKNINFNINKALIDINLKNKIIKFDNIKLNSYHVCLKYFLSKKGKIEKIKKPQIPKLSNLKFITFKKVGDSSNDHKCDGDRLGAIIGYDKNIKKLENKINKFYYKTSFTIK